MHVVHTIASTCQFPRTGPLLRRLPSFFLFCRAGRPPLKLYHGSMPRKESIISEQSVFILPVETLRVLAMFQEAPANNGKTRAKHEVAISHRGVCDYYEAEGRDIVQSRSLFAQSRLFVMTLAPPKYLRVTMKLFSSANRVLRFHVCTLSDTYPISTTSMEFVIGFISRIKFLVFQQE